MPTPNPTDTPDAYETFRLQGVVSPGFCKFEPVIRETGWDIQVPQGSSGGVLVRKTQGPIEITCDIYLWKGEDREGAPVDHFAGDPNAGGGPKSGWEDFKKILDSKPTQMQSRTEDVAVGKNPDGSTIFVRETTRRAVVAGLQIRHPQLLGLTPAVTQVVVKSCSSPTPDGQGGAHVKIVFLEHKPLKDVVIAPAMSGKTTAKDDPNVGDKDNLDYANYIAGKGGRSFLGQGNSRPSFDEWKAQGKPLQ